MLLGIVDNPRIYCSVFGHHPGNKLYGSKLFRYFLLVLS